MRKKENISEYQESIEKAVEKRKELEHDRRINFSSDDVYDREKSIYRKINPDILEYVLNDNNRD